MKKKISLSILLSCLILNSLYGCSSEDDYFKQKITPYLSFEAFINYLDESKEDDERDAGVIEYEDRGEQGKGFNINTDQVTPLLKKLKFSIDKTNNEDSAPDNFFWILTFKTTLHFTSSFYSEREYNYSIEFMRDFRVRVIVDHWGRWSYNDFYATKYYTDLTSVTLLNDFYRQGIKNNGD